jgi:hypothetical protein
MFSFSGRPRQRKVSERADVQTAAHAVLAGIQPLLDELKYLMGEVPSDLPQDRYVLGFAAEYGRWTKDGRVGSRPGNLASGNSEFRRGMCDAESIQRVAQYGPPKR